MYTCNFHVTPPAPHHPTAGPARAAGSRGELGLRITCAHAHKLKVGGRLHFSVVLIPPWHSDDRIGGVSDNCKRSQW